MNHLFTFTFFWSTWDEKRVNYTTNVFSSFYSCIFSSWKWLWACAMTETSCPLGVSPISNYWDMILVTIRFFHWSTLSLNTHALRSENKILLRVQDIVTLCGDAFESESLHSGSVRMWQNGQLIAPEKKTHFIFIPTDNPHSITDLLMKILRDISAPRNIRLSTFPKLINRIARGNSDNSETFVAFNSWSQKAETLFDFSGRRQRELVTLSVPKRFTCSERKKERRKKKYWLNVFELEWNVK